MTAHVNKRADRVVLPRKILAQVDDVRVRIYFRHFDEQIAVRLDGRVPAPVALLMRHRDEEEAAARRYLLEAG